MFYQLLNLIQVNPERRQNQELPVQIFDLLVQFGHRAQGTGRRAQDAGHRAQGAEHRAQGTGRRAQGTGHRAQSAGHRVQGAGTGLASRASLAGLASHLQ